MSAALTLSAVGPLGATPTAGLLAWLASAWKQLHASLASSTATKQEEQIIHFFEFAGSRFGDRLLEARDEDELDDQLDALLDSADVQHMVALAGALALSLPRADPVSLLPLTKAVGSVLGDEPMKELDRASPLLAAWLSAQRDVLALIPSEAMAEIPTRPWTDPEIPADVGEAAFHGIRLSLCLLAIVRALAMEKSIERWMAAALVRRLVESTRAHLRLLASVPGVSVPEDIIPKADRLDLASIERRHTLARSAAQRSLAEARARLGS